MGEVATEVLAKLFGSQGVDFPDEISQQINKLCRSCF